MPGKKILKKTKKREPNHRRQRVSAHFRPGSEPPTQKDDAEKNKEVPGGMLNKKEQKKKRQPS